ncbi:hypothetical protein [Couchioplanes caeruleus]|uniref:CDP-diglyceride synthetase n=2 Tax=Couchioplanes caeruleus TaxID=56438 RepID=A0A1K0FY47_9ACTN|nr:hypothetical protein [Couchioplanes caeruleus]OJF09994.1 hypothetical protein BG844_34450 [Couchioplanes caeruleus subsp. caeruleus]ROP31672.1 hypothetical protein EDD30_4594 [Couchioplanes caeruleus]
MGTIEPRSGTIAGVLPTTPRDSDPWDDDVSREIARSAPGRSSSGFYAGAPEKEPEFGKREEHEDEEFDEEIPVAPVRRKLSVAIAGFAALLGVGLILGAQSSGPDARLSYAIVVFGVQLLYVLAFTMAVRPPAAGVVAGVCAAAGGFADWLAVRSEPASMLPLLYVTGGAFVVALVGQAIRARDRMRLRDALGGTFLIVFGVVSFALLIVLTRRPVGTQAILVCLTAAGIALLVAHLTDAVWPKPRIAAQVPRGAAGIVLGAMLGTLAAAGLGSVLVLPLTPGKGAVLGFAAAGIAGLVDLAVNYSEAGRSMAGDAPTFWVARHMQGPLGAFALSLPATYALTYFFLS